ncbi:lysozyme [bacterium]|nr:MAG: lysozyme [bacterium]
MRLDDLGKQFIKDEEGLVLTAYLCPASVWTIGYGNTYYLDNSKVKKGDKITKEQAVKLFESKLGFYENTVSKNIKVELNQNKFNALVSFCYNVGASAFLSSTLLKKVNVNADDELIAKEFSKWIYAKGKVLPVLQARRKREIKLFIR